jgi:hypothetical protein
MDDACLANSSFCGHTALDGNEGFLDLIFIGVYSQQLYWMEMS